MESKVELNKGHYFELGDRLHVAMCSLSEFIVSHPGLAVNPEMVAKVEEAQGLLMDAYQWAWREYDKYDDEDLQAKIDELVVKNKLCLATIAEAGKLISSTVALQKANGLTLQDDDKTLSIAERLVAFGTQE